MRRVFIVHGWDGFPKEGWFPWLQGELEKQGFKVEVPAMPNPSDPRPETWVPYLASIVGKPDKETYFVGHSMGVQTILRYLAGLQGEIEVGGLVSVAGFSSLKNIEPEGESVRSAWLDSPLDTAKVARICPRVVAIFSPTDKWVPLENEKWFKDKLRAETIVISGKGEKGHFSGSDGVVELPEVLASILKIAATPTITIDEFLKNDLRVGKVLQAERIVGADKLLKLTIDLGPLTSAGTERDIRTICSGVAEYYQPEFLIGKSVIVIANLAPRMMRGVESKGMVLMASTEGQPPILISPISDVPAGSKIK